MPPRVLPPRDLGPPPPPGPIDGLPRPPRFAVGPGCNHGLPGTYKLGCRCPWCREAWRNLRRDKERARRRVLKLEEARELLRSVGELP